MWNGQIERQFASENALRDWLDKRRWEAGSPEAYDEWLQYYFDSGDTITVNGVGYDYMECCVLL